MKNLVVISFITFFTNNFLFAQNAENKMSFERYRLQKEGMSFLSGWATSNIIGGTVGYLLAEEKQWKYFHEMNVFWNTVNLGLGIAALATLPKKSSLESFSQEKAFKAQLKIEKIFLINSGLDLIYMGVGLGLNLYDDSSGNPARTKGYGNSLLLQGGFNKP